MGPRSMHGNVDNGESAVNPKTPLYNPGTDLPRNVGSRRSEIADANVQFVSRDRSQVHSVEIWYPHALFVVERPQLTKIFENCLYSGFRKRTQDKPLVLCVAYTALPHTKRVMLLLHKCKCHAINITSVVVENKHHCMYHGWSVCRPP